MRLPIVSSTQGQPERAPLTLYDLLGASPDDDAEALRNAFRQAVKANHPDLNPGDSDAPWRFSGIVRAYAILRDTQERASYDRALGFEREPLRPRPKRTIFDTMHNIVSEAAVIVVLAVALGGGYMLLADVYRASVGAVKVVEANAPGPVKIATVQPAAQAGTTGREAPRDELESAEAPNIAIAPSEVASVGAVKVAEANAPGPVKIAAVQPAAQTGTTDREAPRDELESVKVPNIAIAPSVVASVVASTVNSGRAPGIDNDGPVASLPKRDVEGAKTINASGDPPDQADAKTSTDQVKKSNGIGRLDQNQNVAPSADVEFSSRDKDNSVPKSPSSDSTIPEQRRHVKTPDINAPDMATHAKPRTVAIRQTPSHAPLKQAALENRSTSACSDAQSCLGKVPPLLGVGF